MVEYVEEFHPQFRGHPLSDFRALDEREVHVFEARPKERIPLHGSEAGCRRAQYVGGNGEEAARGNWGAKVAYSAASVIGEPLNESSIACGDICNDVINDIDRSQLVRPDRVSCCTCKVVQRDHIHRVPTLELSNAGEFPAFDKAVAMEWQIVEAAENEAMARIIVG